MPIRCENVLCDSLQCFAHRLNRLRSANHFQKVEDMESRGCIDVAVRFRQFELIYAPARIAGETIQLRARMKPDARGGTS